MMLTLFSILICVSSYGASAEPFSVSNISWNDTVYVSKTATTLQVVSNSLLTRASPIHDQAWQSLADLVDAGARMVRLAFWNPLPRITVAQLTPPSGYNLCGYLNGGSNDNNWNLTLACPAQAGVINRINFAYWGAPTAQGSCGNWQLGTCYAPNAAQVIKSECLGQKQCTIVANSDVLNNGTDPCPGVQKALAVEVQCSDPDNANVLHSNWDFTYMNDMVEDFMHAVNPYNNETERIVVSLAPFPNWMFENVFYGQESDKQTFYDSFADSPYDISWGYTYSSLDNLTDPTGAQVGEYFKRVYQYYTQGGFYDSYNQFIASNYSYLWDTWEVMNEPDFGNSPHAYTVIYDASTEMLSQAIGDGNNIKFMGPALALSDEWNWYNYFLNKSNHRLKEETQIDYISFHRYASCSNTTDVSEYTGFFATVDALATEVETIIQLRDKYDEDTKLDIDEFGVGLPNDNVDGWPFPPDVYYNAAGAFYAYGFMKLSLLGVDYLGFSQLMGNPETNSSVFTQNGQTGLEPQYPSVSLLHWSNGVGNKKYWVLKMLLQHFAVGDEIVASGTQPNADVFYYQGYVSASDSSCKLLIVNKQNYGIDVLLTSDEKYNYDDGGILYYIDEFTGDNDAKQIDVVGNSFSLNRFAVAVFYPNLKT